jgi:hypothetical protein
MKEDQDPHDEGAVFEDEPPMLYGIIIAHCIVQLVTLDKWQPHKSLRPIAIFDLGDNDMDVWNGIAIAILICLARTYFIDRVGKMEDEEPDTEAEETS